MAFNIREVDLAKLNSLTKYPSIPTYHLLDPKNGGLVEEVVAFDGLVIGTEKIDGTNARIICLPDGNYLLGSREELLYAKGDLIGNPSLGIVVALKDLAEQLCGETDNKIIAYYVEVYGGKVTAASKHYTSEQKVSFRLFDVAVIGDYEPLLNQSAAQLAAWRDSGGQSFVGEETLQEIAAQKALTLTPRLFTLATSELPTSIEAALAFLKQYLPHSLSTLDTAASAKPEGIVLRAPDRSQIAKARYEDYERTIRKRK